MGHGEETEHEITIKVRRYTPGKDGGRMHLRMGSANADWSDGDEKGSLYMPVGAAATIVSINREDGRTELFTFDGEQLVGAALKLYREEHREPK